MSIFAHDLRHRTAGALFSAWVLAYLDRQILTLMAPELKVDLHLSDVQLSLLQGLSFSFVFGITGLLGGTLVDRYSRRNLIAFGIGMWSVMTLASGFSTTFGQLFAARMGVGIGEACLAPASVSIIGDIFGAKQRGRMMGIMLGGASIGAALSVIISGQILRAVGPGTVAVPVVGAVRAWELTFMSVGLAGVPVCLWVLSLAEPHRGSPGSPTKAGEIFATGFWSYLGRHGLLFPLILASFGCKLMVGYGGSIWFPTAFRRVYAVDPGSLGLIVGSATLVTGLIGGIVGGWLSDRWAERDPAHGRLKLYQLCLASQFATFTLVLLVPGLWPTMIGYGLFLVVIGLNAAIPYTILSELVPPGFRGQVTALLLLVANVAGLGLGPLLIAFLTDKVFHDEAMIVQSIAIVSMAASSLGWLAMRFAYRRAGRQRRSLMD